MGKKERKMRSPIWWFGGKGNLAKKILQYFPEHYIYVEPFGGGASLLFAKEPSPVEVYNDIDSSLINFFRVLRDPEKFEQFYRKVCLTPYSREEYYFCRDTWEDCKNEIERAYRWYVVARMSFSGRFGSGWGYSIKNTTRGMSDVVNSWLSIIDMLPEIHRRIMRVQIEHKDFREILRTYDTEDTLFYNDPPYVHSVRKGGKYKYEMSDDDHRELVEMLLNLKGKAILSGYYNEIYLPLEQAGWQRIDFPTACYAAGRTRETKILGKGSAREKQPRVESIWISPNAIRNIAG